MRVIVRRFSAALLSAAILLSGCGLAPDAPETLRAGEKTFRTGFYGSLHPDEFSLTQDSLQAGSITLERIECDVFELYHADAGPYSEGTVYCEESWYEQAEAYYSDPGNYVRFCILGSDAPGAEGVHTVELPDADAVLFDDLLRFAEESGYDPFDRQHNSGVETVELPMPDDKVDTRMVFYKRSRDGLFTSEKGSDFYFIGGRLMLVYQYDFGDGGDGKLIAVEAPEQLSAYFISFMEPYF